MKRGRLRFGEATIERFAPANLDHDSDREDDDDDISTASTVVGSNSIYSHSSHNPRERLRKQHRLERYQKYLMA